MQRKSNNYIVAADLHGNMAHYEKLLQATQLHSASAVFLCGDLLPKDGGTWTPENEKRTIQVQKKFIEDFLANFLQRLSDKTTVYAIYGNDDFKSTYKDIINTNSNIIFLDNQISQLSVNKEYFVAGYPYVPLTPFLHKDWEKWDTAIGDTHDKICTTQGFKSVGNTHEPIDFTSNKYTDTTIEQDLNVLAPKSPPDKTIYLMHAPPYGTPLDMVSSDNPFLKNSNKHVGSLAIKDFIEKHNPLLTLHGHIHESMQQSGEFFWKHDNSISVNPSHNFKSDYLSYILFDIENLSKLKRLII